MYIGHIVLFLILAVILAAAGLFQGKRKWIFPAVCLSISVFFTYASIQYYFDVFHNKMTDGFGLTWSMYLLTQNEDFVTRNGYYFGLYVGVGIAVICLILAGLSFCAANKNRKNP